MPQRQHARVRLRLPVRQRWVAPLGQQAEICETRNVSRGGLLQTCKNHHAEGFPLWVTFPYDAGNTEAQHEVLARVVLTKVVAAGSAGGWEIAVHFEGAGRPTTAYRGQILNVPVKNGVPRTISMPIRVRPRHIPWHEEAMTIEVSSDKIRFLSNREYEAGETLLVTFLNLETKPWQGSGEIAATIEKIEKMPQSSSLIITLKRAA